MSNAAIVVMWGAHIPGRELKALGLFEEAVQYYAKLKEKGEIDSAEPVILRNPGADLAGLTIIRGDREKLHRIQNSPEARRFDNRSGLLLHNFKTMEAFIGDGLQPMIAEWASVVKELA